MKTICYRKEERKTSNNKVALRVSRVPIEIFNHPPVRTFRVQIGNETERTKWIDREATSGVIWKSVAVASCTAVTSNGRTFFISSSSYC